MSASPAASRDAFWLRIIGLLSLAILMSYLVNGMFHDVSIIPMVGSLFYFFAGLTNQLQTTALFAVSNATPELVAPEAAVGHRLAS